MSVIKISSDIRLLGSGPRHVHWCSKLSTRTLPVSCNTMQGNVQIITMSHWRAP